MQGFTRALSRLCGALAVMALLAACGGGHDADQDMASSNTPATDAAGTAADTAAMDDTTPMAVPRTPSPDGARVFFVTPADGATVSSPVHIEFGLDGMEVAPAGTDAPNSGHHHVIVDADLPPFDQPIPADEHHVHFGTGATSTDLPLTPGEHTLQLLFADSRHIPHDPPVYSERITITVE